MVVKKIYAIEKKLGLNGQKEDRALANDQLKISPFMNFIMGTILGIEGKLINMGVRMPFGTSILVPLRKILMTNQFLCH